MEIDFSAKTPLPYLLAIGAALVGQLLGTPAAGREPALEFFKFPNAEANARLK
jgi:hypothetical protein